MLRVLSIIKKSVFVRNSGIYVLSSIISSGFGFLTLTVLTQSITPSDIGKIESFLTLSTLFYAVLLWGNELLLINYYSKYGSKSEFKIAFYGILFQSFLLIIVSSFIPFFFEDIGFDITYCAFAFAFLNSIVSLITASFQLEAKVLQYAIVTILVALGTFIFCICILKIEATYIARLLGAICSLFFVLIFCFPKFYKEKLSLKYPYIKGVHTFYSKGTLLVSSQLSSWGIERIDRLQIISILGLEQLGVYSVAAQFSLGAMVVEAAISRAWQPYVIKHSENHRNAMKYQILKVALALFLVIMILSLCVGVYIKFFLPQNYLNAIYLSIVLCFGYFFDGIWKLYNNIVIYENKYKFYSSTVVTCAILKFCLNFFLIPYYGLMGAAMTSLAVFIIGLLLNIYYVHYQLNWFSK